MKAESEGSVMSLSFTSALEVPKVALREGVPERLSTALLAANLTAVVVPFLGLVTAVVFLWGRGFSWVDLGLLVGMYFMTSQGITVGFHRLFTHHSFETNRVVQVILAALGSMAVQGPLMQWVAFHRLHHQHSDTPGDPHSPHNQGHGLVGMLRGAWHAHVGWILKPNPPNLSHYVPDIRRSCLLRAVSSLFLVWVAVGLLIPAVLGGLLTGTWTGVLFGLLWGGLVRIFLVHHVTWSVNSICHIWGGRPYPNHDQSRNNFLVGILAMGEGWHNNHHAFPTSARHGLRWWQLDASYWVIRMLALVRLAWDVRLPASLTVARSKST
jgi:stearoyl-CoA desaturase (Delta-9 desaturase)